MRVFTRVRIAAALALTLLLASGLDAERVNLRLPSGGFITITPGTPIRLVPFAGQPYYMNRWMIQVMPNTTGTPGYVTLMLGVPVGTTCSASNAAHVSATLAPATSTSPGGSLSDPQGANGDSPPDAEDMTQACVDGTSSTDRVSITGWHRN